MWLKGFGSLQRFRGVVGSWGLVLSKGSCMGPQSGPLPPLEASEVWALGLHRVYKGYFRGPHLRPFSTDHEPTT